MLDYQRSARSCSCCCCCYVTAAALNQTIKRANNNALPMQALVLWLLLLVLYLRVV
jgi:hypothetical protein